MAQRFSGDPAKGPLLAVGARPRRAPRQGREGARLIILAVSMTARNLKGICESPIIFDSKFPSKLSAT